MQLFETVVSNLGSRFTLNLLPHRRQFFLSPLGYYLHAPVDLAVGIQVGDDYRILPFSDRYKVFPTVEQEVVPSGVRFRARDPELGLAVEVSFRSAFYPRDVLLSTAPFCYVEVTVRRLPGRQASPDPIEGRIFMALRPGPEFTHRKLDSGFAFSGTFRPAGGPGNLRLPDHLAEGVPAEFAVAALEPEPELGDRRVSRAFTLADQDSVSEQFILAGYCSAEVFATGGECYRFKYSSYFASIEEVVSYAASERAEIERKMESFDALIGDSSLPRDLQQLIAYSLQTYLANTFWMTRHGEDWFSVWEGNCLFNSTVDVEYNVGLFYLSLWPELLELTLEEWTRHEQQSLYGSFLSHDMGAGFKADGQSYPHAMEVEENTNFLLMTYAVWRFTRSDRFITERYGLIRRLASYVLDADTTGNGFPNIGVANTIDDAAPAVQCAREQVYLAVKALSALSVTALIADRNGDAEFASRCRERVALIRQTLDAEAWLGDHYAVCLERQMDDIVDAWTGERIGSGELPGWDAYSIYTANGLLYPLLTGYRPDVDYSRLRRDLMSATRQAMTEYGCTHTSADQSNVWVSQNLWRDCVAAYLGVDQLDLASRYWAFQVYENTVGRGGCFIDTYGWNTLNFYPRGITSIGAFLAAAGLSVDRVEGRVSLNPVRAPLHVPLLPLADWQEGIVPWLDVDLADGEVRVHIRHQELLQGMRILVYGTPLS